MRVSQQILSRFTDLPSDAAALRELLDDVGIEVKRVEATQLLSQPDTVFDVELLANRGDHYCYAGIARELHARTGGGLNLPQSVSLETGDCPVPISLESDLCLIYTATLLELDATDPLPVDVLAPLTAAEIHSILPAIDVTNLVNIELGQPTHVFDADKVAGGITIRISERGETALPLFSEKRIELPEGTLVIADQEKVLAVAGVIGCEESKATASSKRLVLESALFDPVSVRRTSRVLGIRTDSSIRFERGGDPDGPLNGAGRAVALLQEYCGAKRVGPTQQVGNWRNPNRRIEFDPDFARDFLGLSVTAGEMSERLERYGYEIEESGAKLLAGVPGHRLWDVEYPADVYEDIAKSVGYAEVPSLLPEIDLGSHKSHAETVQYTVEELLVSEGFYEVFTDSFYGPETAQMLRQDEPAVLLQHVGVLDAADKGHSLLKNNALIQLVEGISDNLRMSDADIKMFEWTRTFHENRSAPNQLCDERQLLALVCCGRIAPSNWAEKPRIADAWYLKGLVVELANALQVPLEVDTSKQHEYPLSACLHPTRQAIITLANQPVGILGEVHPDLVRQAAIKRKNARPCFLEIEREALNHPTAASSLTLPTDRPSTRRDLAFVLPGGVEAKAIQDVIRDTAQMPLENCRVVDCFILDSGERVLTFALFWSNEESTKTADELNGATDAARAAVETEFSEVGVKLR